MLTDPVLSECDKRSRQTHPGSGQTGSRGAREFGFLKTILRKPQAVPSGVAIRSNFSKADVCGRAEGRWAQKY